MASEVSICNRALQRLGDARIVSLTDANKNARACNNSYAPVRDAALRRHRWNFAIKRAELAANVTGPAFGETNYFDFPSDLLRLLPPRDHDLDWIVEGKQIATYWSAPLEIMYIRQVTDPNDMDVLFREYLALQLAHEMCEEITQSNTKQAAIRDELKDLLAEAKRTNAIEQMSDELPEDDWITVRNDGRLPINK